MTSWVRNQISTGQKRTSRVPRPSSTPNAPLSRRRRFAHRLPASWAFAKSIWGSTCRPGAQITSLQQLDPIYVDFALPERDQSSLALDQDVSIRIKARPGQQYSGTISAIDPRIDRNTRSVRIRATFANPDRQLLPGMFAEVRVLLPLRSGILTVPRTAITYNTYGDAVFLVQEKDGGLTVEHRQVETGAVRDGRVEIKSGLSAGDRVVNAGQVKLRDGVPVVIDDERKLDKTVSAP